MPKSSSQTRGAYNKKPRRGAPLLVTRDTTERPEAVQAGTVKLVGTHAVAITQNLCSLLTDTAAYNNMAFAHNPYGDGHACQHILQALAAFTGSTLVV